MKYLEDEFDLDEFKKSFVEKNTVIVKKRNIFASFFITVAELILAFIMAYILFRGGQYLIDLFLV